MLGSGVKLGFIGFALGFFGPMILDPSSGNGALLGIFITGPLGFVVAPCARSGFAERRAR